MKAFLDELKRRNVIRVGGIYLVAGWILMQAAALLEDALSMPAWFDTIIVSLILLGFPVVLLFAWLFEVTPEGLRRTPAVDTPEDQAFAASTRRRLDRALIAGIVLAVGVVAADRFLPKATAPASAAATEGAAATLGASQAAAPLKSQRVAFFGFTAADAAPLSKTTAATATEETITDMGLYGLDVASRAETLSTPTDQRLAKAAAVAARWSLSGEVESDAKTARVSLRVEDVSEGSTLWQLQLSTPVEFADSLAAQAAARATYMLQCMRRYGAELQGAEPRLVSAIANVCGGPIGNNPNVANASEIARLLPNSGFAQGRLGGTFYGLVRPATPSARADLIAQGAEATSRALKLDAAHPAVRWAQAFGMQYDGSTTLARETFLTASIEETRGHPDGTGRAALINVHSALLMEVGRQRDALYQVERSIEADPLQTNATARAARLLADFGNRGEAVGRFSAAFRRTAAGSVWTVWIREAVFNGLGGVDEVLRAARAVAPDASIARVSAETIECWTDVARAYVRSTPAERRAGNQRIQTCYTGGAFNAEDAYRAFAAFNDTKSALALIESDDTRQSFRGRDNYFSRVTRSVRATDGFLAFVKRKDIGIWDYWVAKRIRPDVCLSDDEKGYPFCVALEAALR